MAEALNRTPLYETHTSLKARMVPFVGWDMPVQYSGILGETRAVRSGAGLFDVSHMGRLYISGPQAPRLMDWILTAGASNLGQGRARYAMICNEQGGIIDDTVFYRQDENSYLLVCNAANREYVVPWIRRWAQDKFPTTSIDDRTEATAMIAFQGPSTPEVLDVFCDAYPSAMRPFSAIYGNLASGRALIGRTGYTGEDGFELIVAAADAPRIWKTLMGEGAAPCGLGARDVLRLEAGLPLHGNDIDTSTTPLEAGLERFVRLDKEFVGAEVLRRQRDTGLTNRLVGLVLQGRSIARGGYPILTQEPQSLPSGASARRVGKVTSGTHSPTLDRSIAMGYVTMDFASPGQKLQVGIRGKFTEAEVIPLPFYSRNVAR